MAKRRKSTRRARREQRETNWLLVGGIIVAGTVALFALLALALREPEATSLAEFCQENPANCVVKGSADAPVTIVEVSDYGCSHCRDFNLQTAGLIEDLFVTPGEVRWVIIPYALSSQTAPAAEAALCAGEQDRFFEFHQRMFELQSEPAVLTSQGFIQAAEDLGLDLQSFEACLEGGQYENTVQQNIQAASQAGVRVTPTFFINDQKLEGNRPLTTFQEQINIAQSTANAS